MPTMAQQNLIDGIFQVLKADTRVQAAWLSGSLGRGEGDEYSDVDVLVLVADGMLAETARAYVENPNAIAEAVLISPLFGGMVVNVVTVDWKRFDLSFVDSKNLARFDARHLKALFNKTGLQPPLHPQSAYRPSPEAIAALINEFLRVLGLLTVIVGRDERINAFTGIGHLRRLTIDLMLEDNGLSPADRGGALHLNRLLTLDQRRELEAIPPLSADRESIVAVHIALAKIFLPRARRIASARGVIWPDAFEAATRAHLRRNLTLEI